MKKILSLLLTAILLTVFVSLSLLAFNTSAAETSGFANTEEHVIYISGDAEEGGTGTSASDPLYPTRFPDDQLDPQEVEQTQSDGSKITVPIYSYYKNTALYQAVESLAETGGTVVICGNYTITDANARATNYWSIYEYHLPETKETVTIKGYDANSKLTLSGQFFTILNGPTVWEDLTIHSELVTNRAICCNGNKTVFGEGLTCTKRSDAGNESYLSIVGGERFRATNKDVDVTIKSGTFNKFVGTTWTAPDKIICDCDVNLKLEGGSVGYIFGNAHNPTTTVKSIHAGKVDITVTGGTVRGGIVCTDSGGFTSDSNPVYIKISGGSFGNAYTNSKTSIVRGYWQTGDVEGDVSKNITIDLGANNVDDSKLDLILNNIVTYLPEGATVIYPTKWITDNKNVESTPSKNYVFCGEEPSSSGAKVEVEFSNPVTPKTYNCTYEYEKTPSAFTVNCDTSGAGKATAEYYFGDWKYHEAEIDVVAVPEVIIKGVQIRTNTEKQEMYGWGGYTKNFSPDVIIKNCGVLAIPSDMLTTDEPFDHNNTYGMYDAEADKTAWNASYNLFGADVFGDEVIRENNYDRDYSLRAYVKFEYAGKEYYRYSEVIERNVYDVAIQAIAGNKETDIKKALLKNWVIDVGGENYNPNPNTPYNQEASETARQKVVDYMKKMSNIEWTPKETFIIYNDGTYGEYSVSTGSTAMYAIFYKGQTYHGIPYVNKTLTQYESFEEMRDNAEIKPLVDENGNSIDADNFTSKLWSWSLKNNLKREWISDGNGGWKLDPEHHFPENFTDAQKAEGLENAKNFPGSDCWAALIYGWNTVLNNNEETKRLTSIDNMLTFENGTVPVGDYEILWEHIQKDRNRTELITQANGIDKMSEAYAMLKPGDATAYSTQVFNEETQRYTKNNRHVRIVEKVVVEYNSSTNKIDPENSKVYFVHQGAGSWTYIFNNKDRTLVIGTENEIRERPGGEQADYYTFQELYEEGSLPMSIPELMTGNVDTPKAIAMGLDLEEDLPNGLLGGTVKANKQMISVRAVFRDKDGQMVGEREELLSTTYATTRLSEYNLRGLDLSEIDLTAGEEYTFDLYTCISGMATDDTYQNEIHLVDGYKFIAK